LFSDACGEGFEGLSGGRLGTFTSDVGVRRRRVQRNRRCNQDAGTEIQEDDDARTAAAWVRQGFDQQEKVTPEADFEPAVPDRRCSIRAILETIAVGDQVRHTALMTTGGVSWRSTELYVVASACAMKSGFDALACGRDRRVDARIRARASILLAAA
jgi:hypothetical protein